jgi:hypothetical protein
MYPDRLPQPQIPFDRANRVMDGQRYMLRYGAGEWVEVDAILYECALREMSEDPDAAVGIEAAVLPAR